MNISQLLIDTLKINYQQVEQVSDNELRVGYSNMPHYIIKLVEPIKETEV